MRSLTRILAPVAGLALLVGCVQAPAPEPAVQRSSAPPWDAPRDAVSYIDAAGLPHLGLDDTSDAHIVQLAVVVDGAKVTVPAYIGIDRLRAVQAPVHTHDDSGQVWLEGRDNRSVTVAQFFQLWGVRFDDQCLGDACGGVAVVVDGHRAKDPAAVVLRGAHRIEVTAGR